MCVYLGHTLLFDYCDITFSEGTVPLERLLHCVFISYPAGAVRRRFKDSTVSEIMELTGNWLKDAPSRVKKRQRRQESRDEMLQQYEDERSEDTS